MIGWRRYAWRAVVGAAVEARKSLGAAVMADGAGEEELGAGWQDPDPDPALIPKWALALTSTPTLGPSPSLSLALESLQPLQDLTGDGGVRKKQLRPGTGQPVPPSASVAGRAGSGASGAFCGPWEVLWPGPGTPV